jgi:hypothetical protein
VIENDEVDVSDMSDQETESQAVESGIINSSYLPARSSGPNIQDELENYNKCHVLLSHLN